MWFLYAILTFYVFRLLRVLLRKKPNKTLMIVFGSGGHTSEMKRMLTTLDFSRFDSVVCVVANTDLLSQATVSEHFRKLNKDPSRIVWKIIPRSREVKQSYFTSIFTTLYAMLYCFILVLRVEPILIVTNGPGTALPLCYSLKLSKLALFCLGGKVLFIESFCRVDNLSLTGKLVYPIADRFVVQWQGLAKRYKRAEYLGVLV